MPPKPRQQQNVLPRYRLFMDHTLGYMECSLGEFRDRVLPLLEYGGRNTDGKGIWTTAQLETANDIVKRGGGYALAMLCGPRHTAAVARLGHLKPAPMPKQELLEHLRALAENSARDSWSRSDYLRYIDYLDSDLTPADIARRDAERLAREREEFESLNAVLTVGGGKAEIDAGDARPVPGATRDRFATMYREGPFYFQTVIRDYLISCSASETIVAMSAANVEAVAQIAARGAAADDDSDD